VAFVLSMNLKRRHLTESQRAMIAADLAQLKGRPSKESGRMRPLSNKAAAKALKIGPTSVKSAKAVLRYGTPKLVAAVKAGQVSVRKAAQQVRAKGKARSPKPPPVNLLRALRHEARKTAATQQRITTRTTVPPRTPRLLPQVGQYWNEFEVVKELVQHLKLASLPAGAHEIVAGFVLDHLRESYSYADRAAFLRLLAAQYTEAAAITEERAWKASYSCGF
jgi:hypothetical protein